MYSCLLSLLLYQLSHLHNYCCTHYRVAHKLLPIISVQFWRLLLELLLRSVCFRYIGLKSVTILSLMFSFFSDYWHLCLLFCCHCWTQGNRQIPSCLIGTVIYTCNALNCFIFLIGILYVGVVTVIKIINLPQRWRPFYCSRYFYCSSRATRKTLVSRSE